jgi:hypothetical protein
MRLRLSWRGGGLGEAVVRRLIEGKIHPRLDMKVEERLESVTVVRVILHGSYVSILGQMNNSGQQRTL